ncbi:MAG: hypothetical protein JNJ89_11230 [Rubrivivax sp.]|nr:hypothetical protein [Rubrivivax sp.]
MAYRHRIRPGPPAAPRRGAATLIVVMILFFIITLVAAYTSRNLLFEQRTSANQFRSTLAFEAAEAGLEWAIARLNEGRMNDDCTELDAGTAVSAPPQPSFRERYLSIDVTSGAITAVPPTAPDTEIAAGCIFNGVGWSCHCPASGPPAPVVAAYVGNGPFPAFWVKFRHNLLGTPARPHIVRIQVNACTRANANCLAFDRLAESGDGLATVWAMVSLRSGLPALPAAALTVRNTFSDGGRSATVTNEDAESSGITIHSGEAFGIGSLQLNSMPGTPSTLSVWRSDAALAFPDVVTPPVTTADNGRNRMFNAFFGNWPATYTAQPGVVVIDCAADCTAADVNAAVARQPGQPVYLSGGGRLTIGAAIGTAAEPVLIVTEGRVEFDAAVTVHGAIYSRAATWDLDGDGTIRGAAIAERNFTFDDNDLSIIYDRDVLLRLRNRTGSFAKVAGSWRDYQPGPNP